MSNRRLCGMAAASAASVAMAVAVFLPIAAAEPSADYPTDEHGYTGSAARCDDGQTVVEFGRTSRALVAICISPDGKVEYRGVRLSDKAGLTMPATRAADGTVTAVNDGVTYAVTPQLILVSEGDTVIYRDAWVEFRQPRFSGERPKSTTPASSPTSTSSAAPGSSSAPSTSSAPTSSSAPATSANTSPPTVSTTTVTLTPRST